MVYKILPVVAAVCLQCGLAIMSVIAKYALDSGLTPRILVAERLVIAATILTPLAVIFERNTRPPMTARIFALIIIMSIFEPLLEQNLYYSGMQLTTPTFTSGMFNLLPAITFVMACVFRFESVTMSSHRGRAKLFGTLTAVCGAMTMTFWKGFRVPLPWTSETHSYMIHKPEHIVKGSLMLVSSCLSWSFYIMIQTKVAILYPARLSMTAIICILGAIGATVTALIWERNNFRAWEVHADVTMLAILYGGCFSAATVYVVGWMAKTKGPVFVSIFSPVNLIATAIVSSIVFSDQIFVGRIIGAFIITIGISIFLWGKMGEQPRKEHEATTTQETSAVEV